MPMLQVLDELRDLPPAQILALARLRRAVADGYRSEFFDTREIARLRFLKWRIKRGDIER